MLLGSKASPATVITGLFTCDLLKDGMESIEVLGAIGAEKDVEGRACAPNGSWPLVATETLDDGAVAVVPVTNLNIVILTHIVKLQAQHAKPAWGEGDRRSRWAQVCLEILGEGVNSRSDDDIMETNSNIENR